MLTAKQLYLEIYEKYKSEAKSKNEFTEETWYRRLAELYAMAVEFLGLPFNESEFRRFTSNPIEKAERDPEFDKVIVKINNLHHQYLNQGTNSIELPKGFWNI